MMLVSTSVFATTYLVKIRFQPDCSGGGQDIPIDAQNEMEAVNKVLHTYSLTARQNSPKAYACGVSIY